MPKDDPNIGQIGTSRLPLGQEGAAWLEAQQAAAVGIYTWVIGQDRWEGSQALDEILGIGPDYPRNLLGWMDLVVDRHREALRLHVEQVVQAGINFDWKYPIIRPCDGETRWIHGRGKILHRHDGRPMVLTGIIQDITVQHHQSLALERMTRLYSVLAEVNQLLVRVNDQGVLLNGICRSMVETGHFSLAWVAWGGPDQPHLDVAAKYGDATGFVDRSPRRSDDTPAGNGAVGLAIRTGLVQVIHDLGGDPRTSPWRQEMLKLGLASAAAFPLFCNQKVVGALVVYTVENEAFAPEEVSLLRETSADISFALDHLDLESQRARAFEALSLSEEKFSKAFRLSPDAIQINRFADGVYLEVNVGFTRMTGWSAQEVIGRSTFPGDLGIWVSLEDRNRMMELLRKEGWAEAFEAPFRRKDGSILIGLMSASLITVSGELCLLSITREFTEFRAKEAALQRMTRLYHALSQINQAVSRARETEVILEQVCQALVEFGGFKLAWIGWDDPVTHEISIAAQFGDVDGYLKKIRVRSDDTPEGRGPTGRALREGRPVVVNDLLDSQGFAPWRAEAERCGFQSSATFPLWKGGRIIGGLMVYSAEKDFFRTEEISLVEEAVGDVSFALDHLELEKQNALVEKQQKILHEQLAQSQKLESLGSLAGGIAHDLNNVLGAILGAASSLKTGTPASSEPTINTIIQACLRGRSVIKGLMYFARKELQEESLLDMNALVNEVVDLLRHTTFQRLQIVTELDDGLPMLRGDGGALSHTLMNLCVNAFDAMPEGGILTLRTKKTSEKNLEVCVCDTGIGMSPEVLAKAVDPFFTTKPMGKGTGLGLAQAFGTMRAHGGTLLLESRLGKGTTVRLSFPADRLVSTRPEKVFSGQVQTIEPLDVMVVDDDPLIRETMLELLTLLGHRPVCVPGGSEALEKLREGAVPDLVILDMNMPGMNGAQTLARLLEMRPGQAVLITSGYDEGVSDLVNAASVRVLHKPFTADELKIAIGETYSRKWSPR
ncbi:MAG: GAF domain-containing protein [Spirochaetales bacterium]|nr:GAF domain-containing protein [Spirochaetales bacterium]